MARLRIRKQADASFNEVLNLDPERSNTHVRSSVISFEKHDLKTAIEKASKAIEIAPRNTDALVQRGQVCLIVCVLVAIMWFINSTSGSFVLKIEDILSPIQITDIPIW